MSQLHLFSPAHVAVGIMAPCLRSLCTLLCSVAPFCSPLGSPLFNCTTRFNGTMPSTHRALPPALPIMQTRSTSRASSCRRASCITCSPSCRQGAAVVVLCKSCVSGGVTEQQVHAHVSHMSQVNPPCQQSCSKLYPAASSNCRAMRSRRRCGTWRRRGPPPTPTTRPSCSSEWVGWGGMVCRRGCGACLQLMRSSRPSFSTLTPM